MLFSITSILICMSVYHVYSARILAVYPFPSLSHQFVFRTFTTELSKQGHEIVVITPIPMKQDELPENIKEIDTSETNTVLKKALKSAPAVKGIKISAESLTIDTQITIVRMINATFQVEAVKDLVFGNKEHFDLIISQSVFLLPNILSKVFNAPLILISSSYGSSYIYDVMGAPARHPFLYGNFHRNRFYDLTLREKIYELYMEIRLWYVMETAIGIEENLLKEYFGDVNISFDKLNERVDLLFVNVNSIFEGNRPMPPNVINLGGIHLKPANSLTEVWQSYLDSSKNGVIYMSLGTNVRSSSINQDLLDAFIGAFEELPYDILWKFDGKPPKLPKNIRTESWLPQRDLLFHPNVKAFITQGGLQSTDEAIDAGVPLVGIPMLSDQSFNCERYVKLGIGVTLEVTTLTREDLVNGVKKVIDNESYRKNIKKLGVLMRDQPQSPLERAVWWTEYVLRHGGAKHLRSPAANISWTEYLMLDVPFRSTSRYIPQVPRHSIWQEGVLHYACLNVTFTQELVCPIGYQLLIPICRTCNCRKCYSRTYPKFISILPKVRPILKVAQLTAKVVNELYRNIALSSVRTSKSLMSVFNEPR